MNNKKLKLGIVINADECYINKYTITMIKSFLIHNKWFDGDFIFFDDKKFFTISDENKILLKNIYKNIIFKDIDYSKYEYIINSFRYINDNNAYFLKGIPKFEIFSLIEYDKILCIDGDMLFVNSIEDLFKKNISFGGVSTEINEFYINCGLIYLGNKDFINEEITNLLIEFTKDLINNYDKDTGLYNYCFVNFFEQDIFNIFFNMHFKDKCQSLNFQYNFLLCPEMFNDNNIKYDDYEIFTNVKIFHYLYKPEVSVTKYFYNLWKFYENLSFDLIK